MWGGNIGDGIFDETAKQQKSCMRILIFKSVIILQFQWMWDFNWSLGAELSSRKSFLARILKIPGKLAKTFPEGGAPAAKKPRRRLPKQKQQPEKKISDFDQKVMAILLPLLLLSRLSIHMQAPAPAPRHSAVFQAVTVEWPATKWKTPSMKKKLMAATSMFCNQCAHKIFPPGKSERTVEGRRECSFWEKRERESPAGFQFGKSTWRWRDQSGRHSGVLHGGWRHLPRITPACYMIAGCVWPTWLNGTELEKKKEKETYRWSLERAHSTQMRDRAVKPLVREWGHFVEPVRVHDWAGPRRCCLCLLRLWSHGCIAGRSLSSPSHRRHCCSHQQGPTGSQAQLWSHPS